MQKVSVGLVILTHLPSTGDLVAVLQVRGEFNHEKMGPESFPGACQLTVHGKSEKGEPPLTTLLREAREELGIAVGKTLAMKRHKIKKLTRAGDSEELVINYGIFLPHDFLAKIKLHPSSGGLRLLRLKDLGNVKT